MKFCVTDSDKKTTHITYLTKAATTDFYKTSLFFLTCLEIKKKKIKKKVHRLQTTKPMFILATI